ncbi:hypothetical protein F4782DRAFT_496484 [Xylaria castorea]|nr:hypothetical protein F4782DRAFT_496484 [Xylaria castorea]
MTTTDDSSDAVPEWTREEDRIICVRKFEAKSWAEIGKELQRGRRECQQRHRALSSHAKELGITTAKLAKLYIKEEDDEGEDESKPKKSNKDRDEGKSKNSNKKTDKSKARYKDKSKGAANYDSKSEETTSKSRKKNKKGVSETSSDSESDSGPNSGSSSDDDPESEYWAQRRYIYDRLYGGMYPDQKVLRPDRFYSESDCRVLAGLEARYRANKWLYIQADFCNATGRMVEAEILKTKFYEDQNPRTL